MSKIMRLVAATSLVVLLTAVVEMVVQESAKVPVSEQASSLLPESRPDEREEVAKQITDSDLNQDSKSLYERLVMQPEAWRSGLVENLGLCSIVGPKHDPKLVRQVFRSFDLANGSGEKYKVFLADRSGLQRKRVRSTYIVTDRQFALIAWQWTPIDGDLVLKTELKGNSFPAVLQLSEGSRHNGDVGHFEFRLTKRGIEGLRNGFGGGRWPPPVAVLRRRMETLRKREQQLIEQLRSSLVLSKTGIEKICSELIKDANQRRFERAEREMRLIENDADVEDFHVALNDSLDRYEQRIEALASAESDAFRGSLEKLLRLTVKRGLAQSVQILITAGVDVNRVAEGESPPLHEAMFSIYGMPQKTRIIKSLLQAGADPNQPVLTGETRGAVGQALLIATIHEPRPPLVNALLSAGANANATDPGGRNALHLLAYYPNRKESSEVAQSLIEAGCDVNNANWQGETVMHIAAIAAASYPEAIDESVQFLKLILDQKPDLSLRDKRGYRALQSKRTHHVPQGFEKILMRLRDHEVAKPWIENGDQ
jgi:ankyrin repeat protein